MILVTAFPPYNNRPTNSSEQVLSHLPESIGGTEIRKVQLPCDCTLAPSLATSAAQAPSLTAVLALGEEGRYADPTLERTAYNWLDYEVPDNAGNQPKGLRIQAAGPDALNTQLDVLSLRSVLASSGVPLNVSDDPGRHLCNHVYFTLLHQSATHHHPVLMLHLPRLPMEHVRPSAPLEVSLGAALGVLQCLAHEEDRLGDHDR